MRTYNVRRLTRFFSFIVLIFASINPLLSQRTFQPIGTQSLVATPTFLERQSSIEDLEITSTKHLDTLVVNQIALFTGFVKNSGDFIFNAQIDINFNLNQLEDIDFDDINEDLDVDAFMQLPHIPIQPGDSIPFFKFINIDPDEIDPNSNGVIIIWPEFRIAPDEENVETGYSFELFYAAGLNQGGHPGSGGKSLNNHNSLKIKSVSLNSFNNLQNHLIYNNYDVAEIILTTIDGKVILRQNQLPQYSRIENILAQNNSNLALLNVVINKLDAKPEILTLKLHKSTFSLLLL